MAPLHSQPATALVTTKGDISTTSSILADDSTEYWAAVEAVISFREEHQLTWSEFRAVCKAETKFVAAESPAAAAKTLTIQEMAARELARRRAAAAA